MTNPESEPLNKPAIRRSFAVLLLAGGMLGGCNDITFPRDPDDTLETVLATGEMTVAVSDHPPWVIIGDDDRPSGAEVSLVQEFADRLGVDIEWRRLSAFTALQGLKQGEVDLAIGGCTQKALSPHAGASTTYGYYTEALLIATRPNVDAPRDLEDRVVFVPREAVAAKLLRDRQAIPTGQLDASIELAAVAGWRSAGLGFLPTGIVLQKEKHVMAVPQGENAWIMRLERFLRAESVDMGERLREYDDD